MNKKKFQNQSKVTRSTRRHNSMAKSMPNKLLPLPFHRNNIRFFKNELEDQKMQYKTAEEKKNETELPNVQSNNKKLILKGKPIFRQTKYSLKNYEYLCER